jgi:hypothetical protein
MVHGMLLGSTLALVKAAATLPGVHAKHDIIQNINRQGQNYINLKMAHVAYISIHTNYLGQIGERRCAVRCCFICFLMQSVSSQLLANTK